MDFWRYTRWAKYSDKNESLKRFSSIGNWHYLHIQYPVLQIPSPFRGRIRSRLTRYKAFHQSCMPFYKDFFKCAHEVGQPVMHEECWEEFQDMKECESLWKTKIRINVLNAKRHEDGLDFLERPPDYLFHRPFITFRKETKLWMAIMMFSSNDERNFCWFIFRIKIVLNFSSDTGIYLLRESKNEREFWFSLSDSKELKAT